MNQSFERFRNRLMNPVAYRLFLLKKLPLVYFTGIRIQSLSADACTTTVKYGWLNQNPFRSMYFAVMQMAAELSTGALCMGNVYDKQISMLVVQTTADFYRKATGTIRFTCNDGAAINTAVNNALQNDEGVTITCLSVATNEQNEVVAEFRFTWSLKRRSRQP